MSKQEIFDKFIEIMGEFAQIKAVAALRDGFIMRDCQVKCVNYFRLKPDIFVPWCQSVRQ